MKIKYQFDINEIQKWFLLIYVSGTGMWRTAELYNRERNSLLGRFFKTYVNYVLFGGINASSAVY